MRLMVDAFNTASLKPEFEAVFANKFSSLSKETRQKKKDLFPHSRAETVIDAELFYGIDPVY